MTLSSTANTVATNAANAANAATAFSIDPKGVDALRRSAKENSPKALKAVAQQFEGLFMNMIMKSMRDATPKEGLFDSEQGKMFSSMLDQQLSQNLAKRGVGLADMLIRQLSNNRSAGIEAQGQATTSGAAPGATSLNNDWLSNTRMLNPAPGQVADAKSTAASANESAVESGFQTTKQTTMQTTLQTAFESGIPGVLKAALSGLRSAVVPGSAVAAANVDNRPRIAQAAHVRAFEDRLGVHAQEASRSTGIPAKFMLGQAALESGWGKREIVAADGTNSHNVFGIKAGANWKGKVVETATTEYVNGVPERKIERFRAYDNYADAFRDYAKLLQNNPRYQNVLANSQDAQGFAQGLQRAGYATDPHYAAKLTRIITHSLST
ncbi:MAG: flagellar assembly peptidoglycan hydrolase FlgJ [Pseudomonadota bacterium]